MIAGPNLERNSQSFDRAPNQVISLGRSVVGVIAGENGEIDAIGDMLICMPKWSQLIVCERL